MKLGDRTYKNHLDGYDQTAMLTGKGPSTRHEIFYLGESSVGAIRIDDYKYRFIDQPHGWLGEKTHVDVPYLINLRLDPFERQGWPNNGTKEGAQQYFDWFKFQFWRFVFVQQVMGKELQTFLDYPADAAGREFQSRRSQSGDGEKDGPGGSGRQRHRPVTETTFTAGGSQGPPAFFWSARTCPRFPGGEVSPLQKAGRPPFALNQLIHSIVRRRPILGLVGQPARGLSTRANYALRSVSCSHFCSSSKFQRNRRTLYVAVSKL